MSKRDGLLEKWKQYKDIEMSKLYIKMRKNEK